MVEKYENLTIETAWNLYGVSNGVYSLAELNKRVSSYTNKNSKKEFENYNHVIGCIIIKNSVLFNESEQVSLSQYGWEIPKQVVKYKYVESIQPIYNDEEQSALFQLVDDEKQYKHTKSKDRKGQHRFRNLIMRAYDNKCCMTGENEASVLQAAHIQSYISEASNHVQNGLLFRIDLHNLFDAGFITIDEEYKVRVSVYLNSQYYNKFEGCTIFLPEKENLPSIHSLRWHGEYIFRK